MLRGIIPPQWLLRQFSSKALIAVESSCDDTCISRVKLDTFEYSEIKTSYGFVNRIFGGVYPHIIASFHETNFANFFHFREHLDFINHCAGVACAVGPGLHGCLSKGLNFSKLLSKFINVEFFGAHHMVCIMYIDKTHDRKDIYIFRKSSSIHVSFLIPSYKRGPYNDRAY